MSVDLASDIWNEIQRQISVGGYSSHEDVLREALAALRFRDQEVLAIQEGIDDMEAGRVTPLAEFDREFRRRNGLTAAE
jgi:Arc/MetJ-type ribon-helix-helix transcriptional regulator